MTEHAAQPAIPSRPVGVGAGAGVGVGVGVGVGEAAREITGYWWVSLVSGIAWLAASLVILQFDSASATTVGIIVGVMFMVAGIQNIGLSTVPTSLRWVSGAFGVLFVLVGIWWMVRAGLQQPGGGRRAPASRPTVLRRPQVRLSADLAQRARANGHNASATDSGAARPLP
jgi:hypothetical protein